VPCCMGTVFFEKNERHAAWERSWGGPGGVRGGLGGLLGRLGGVLGRLGPAGVILGRFRLNRVGWAPDSGQFWKSKREPRWSQNGTQDGSKSMSKTSRKKISFNIHLKEVLGRSWAVLGAILG